MNFRRLLLVLPGLLPGILSGQSPPTLFRESFDTTMPPALPNGWSSSQVRSPGVNDFTTTTSTPRSAPNAVLSTNATVPQELRTPALDCRSVFPDSISFYVRRSSSHQAKVVMEASTDGGASFPIPVGDTLRGSATTSYLPARWPLPLALAGSATVRFRWRVIADAAGSTGTFRIDDVSITGRPLHDLVLQSVSILPERPRPDDSLRATIAVANAGRQPAGAYSVNLFVDEDADSTGDPAELIGAGTGLPGLPAGDSTRLEVVTGPLAPGHRLLIVRLEYAPDQDSSTNMLVLPISIGFPAQSVVINEIMYAPEENEPEWVELLNLLEQAVDVRDWVVSDNTITGRRPISASSRSIPPHGMVVLSRDSLGLRARYPLMPPVVITVAGFPALNNTGDAVVLYDDRMSVMDSLFYSPSWGGGGGGSLERIDPAAEGNDPHNWCTSADTLGATPGAANSVVILDEDLRLSRFPDQTSRPGLPAEVMVVVQNAGRQRSGSFGVRLFDDADGDSLADPGELAAEAGGFAPLERGDSAAVRISWNNPPSGLHPLIVLLDYTPDMRLSNNTGRAVLKVSYAPGTIVVNEIMAEPFADRAEYVEVMNPSGADVDFTGWHLRGTSGATRFPLGAAGRQLHSGEYLVIASDSSLFNAFPSLRGADARLIEILDASLGLNNDRDEVVIGDLTGTAVDSVFYSASWHNPGVGDPSGRSLERVRPNQGSNDPRNWSTSTSAAGGTPGCVNSIFTTVLPAASSMSVSPNPFSPDGDGREDFAVVQFHLPLQVSVVRLRIYDVRGRLIRTLANNEPAGPNGEVTWDGTDDARRRARIGIYILLLEAIDDLGGVVETAKGTVVLAGRL